MSYIDKIKKIQRTSEQIEADAIKTKESIRINCLHQKIDVIMEILHNSIETATVNGLHNINCVPTVEYQHCEYDNQFNSFSNDDKLLPYQYNTTNKMPYEYKIYDKPSTVYGHTYFEYDFAYIPMAFSTAFSCVLLNVPLTGSAGFAIHFYPELWNYNC